jgi:hypothetical protein
MASQRVEAQPLETLLARRAESGLVAHDSMIYALLPYARRVSGCIL